MAAKRLRFGSILAVLLSLLLISAPYSTNANDLVLLLVAFYDTVQRGMVYVPPVCDCFFLFLLSIICRSLRLRSNNNKFILINNMQQRQAALWRSQGRRNGFGMWVRPFEDIRFVLGGFGFGGFGEAFGLAMMMVLLLLLLMLLMFEMPFAAGEERWQ